MLQGNTAWLIAYILYKYIWNIRWKWKLPTTYITPKIGSTYNLELCSFPSCPLGNLGMEILLPQGISFAIRYMELSSSAVHHRNEFVSQFKVGIKYNKEVATKPYACHASYAVVACTKFVSSVTPTNWITVWIANNNLSWDVSQACSHGVSIIYYQLCKFYSEPICLHDMHHALRCSPP